MRFDPKPRSCCNVLRHRHSRTGYTVTARDPDTLPGCKEDAFTGVDEPQ